MFKAVWLGHHKSGHWRRTVHVVGVYDVEKSNVAIPLGSKVYWDATAKKAVVVAAENTLLGVAEVAAEDSIARIRTLHYPLSVIH